MNRTLSILQQLHRYESQNVTFLDPDGTWPIVWARAKGVYVWDAEEKRYLDLTAAFGVAAAGHANPAVVRAGQKQMGTLLHAMGDVHPHALKAQLAQELSRLTFERWRPKTKVARAKTIFCNSGFEAVEAALKTAIRFTGRSRIIAFQGAYHGLGYGALNATHREHFRAAFRPQLRQFGQFLPFPSARKELSPLTMRIRELLRTKTVGAILVEPIQVRGGINIPPQDFLPQLRKLCDEYGALLVLDEIYTGFGRTGKWFACEHTDITPDLICLGKALTGGFPLSACVGRADIMDAAWPSSDGEAIHTSTFLGHPVGCAMALAQIRELQRRKLCERSAKLGALLLPQLQRLSSPSTSFRYETCGLGLLAGLELRQANGVPATALALRVIKAMLQRGYILLPEGEHSNVISLTPPLVISEAQLAKTVRALEICLRAAIAETKP